jgi:hypothetical protein
LLDSNDELYQEWTVIVHHRGYFRIWSSSCKSVHNRSNISYTEVNTRTRTQPGIRGARRLAPLAAPHTICNETHIEEAYGITLFLGHNDPRASRVQVPHAPAVYPIGMYRAAYSTADGRLIRRQYTPAATYVSHMMSCMDSCPYFSNAHRSPIAARVCTSGRFDSTHLQLTS